MKKLVMLASFGLCGLSTIAVVQAQPTVPQDPPHVQRMIALYPDLIKRIAPYGNACVQGQRCRVVVPVVAAAAPPSGEPRSGEAVYQAVCTTCHAGGLLGAPVTGDKAAWSARIAKGKDTLYSHSINGFNSMPAQGGGELSDQEVKNGVDYLISRAQ